MLKKIISLVTIFTVTMLPIAVSAQTVSNEKKKEVSPEEVEAMASELEYIFTEIAVKDESTGEYVLDKQELNNSSFSEKEKDGILNVLNYMNSQKGITTFDNAFKRCWADAVGIAGDVLDEFLGYVENKDWIAAAGILALAGISINPAVIFVFSLTCGATPVE
ncbi:MULTISPECIES: hypothetical protein [Clostridia]|uniref:hypothetical protein n=1 Tax=Clostridia TaxID=186801 RepID=UPI000EA1D72B|nr:MULTISPECIES: hypothetical protein [Clostridia]NBJ68934.1 hypothetical protein [Roseburia sp. 1XD42-34]RKI79839.1 hypothetical protein D7V87_05525 [Clostridium sp. 1xD42-85]